MAKMATQSSELNASTRLQLGNMIFILAAVISATVWCTRTSLELTAIRVELNAAAGNQWTSADMSEWVRASNREVAVWSMRMALIFGVDSEEWDSLLFPDPDKMRHGVAR